MAPFDIAGRAAAALGVDAGEDASGHRLEAAIPGSCVPQDRLHGDAGARRDGLERDLRQRHRGGQLFGDRGDAHEGLGGCSGALAVVVVAGHADLEFE